MKISRSSHDGAQHDDVVARNQAARKSRPLLDPHGIYGTRTAYRVRAAQRRRKLQNLAAAGGLAAIFIGATLWTTQKRVAVLQRVGQSTIAARAAGFPAWTTAPGSSNAWLLVPTQSGSLVPVEAATGRPGTPFRAAFAFRAQPVVAGSTAFAVAEDGTVFAVDWQSARALWTFQGAASSSTRPALVQIALPGGAAHSQLLQLVVCGDDDGNVVALEAKSGKVAWRQALRAPVGNGLTSVGNGLSAMPQSAPQVLVPLLAGRGTQGGAACLDARSGKILWRADWGAAFVPPPAVLGNRAFFAGDNGSLLCVDVQTGRKTWKAFASPRADSRDAVVLRGEPLAQSYAWGERVFCGGNDGVLRCFDAANGHALWRFSAAAPIRCAPRALRLKDAVGVARDALLCGSEGDWVYALDAQGGALLWKARTSGSAFATPGVARDSVITLGGEGAIERFALPQ